MARSQPESEFSRFTRSTKGLEYLHAQNIIHGNVIAANVLVKGGRAKIGGLMTLQINTPDSKLSLCPGAPESTTTLFHLR